MQCMLPHPGGRHPGAAKEAASDRREVIHFFLAMTLRPRRGNQGVSLPAGSVPLSVMEAREGEGAREGYVYTF